MTFSDRPGEEPGAQALPPPLSSSSGTSTPDGSAAPAPPTLRTIPGAQTAPGSPVSSGGSSPPPQRPPPPAPPPSAPSTPLGLADLAKGGRRAGPTPVFVMLPLDTVRRLRGQEAGGE